LFARILSTIRPAYRVMRADNGREALIKMRENKPDVVLLDLIMPGMDGFQVLQEKKEDSQISQIPVIIVSSNDPAGIPVISNQFNVEKKGGFSMRELLDCIMSVYADLVEVPKKPGPE
jgi:CheY-like chemotaxis protein